MSNQVRRAIRLNSTILLPKTSFPIRATPEALSQYLKRSSDDLYTWQRQALRKPESSRERQKYVLHDGPPYANGDLHVGHALNKILKDIICRVQLAQGKEIDFVPGWDCHGLPIELKALERHQKASSPGATSPSPVEIREIARRLAEDTVESQKAQFRSWGIMADWDNAWRTMDRAYELRQLFIFLAFFNQGLIQRQHKPVYWSPSSKTALAEAELEYKEDHKSTAALVAFNIDAPKEIMAGQFSGLKALIWTTTPWTLPANQAIALREEMVYTIIESKQYGHLLVAKSRLDFVKEKMHGDEISIIQNDILGSFFIKHGFTYKSPFDRADINRPIFAAPFVTDSAGTGLVHCAPGHGMEDYEALRQQIKAGKVKVKAPIDDAGHFTHEAMPDDPGYLAGSFILGEGQKKVLRYLEDKNMLLSSYPYKHSYPYDWRSKKPVVIRATAQWFADVHGIKNRAVQALGGVKFLPATGKSRLTSFLERRNEWCISRQRAWGVPIPALYDVRTGEAIMTKQTISHIMKVLHTRGTDAWWSDSPDDPAWVHPSLLLTSAPSDYRRGTDTMDVWFDSGTSWAELLQKGESDGSSDNEHLADLYIEGTDQHRGWFQSSLLTSIAYQSSLQEDTRSKAPYASLITHGFTLDGQGKKMSKSVGNVVSPIEIIQNKFRQGQKASGLGPDALRLWIASSDFTNDVLVSQQSVSNAHGLLHKFRNTFKLILGNLHDFDPTAVNASQDMDTVEGLALVRLQRMEDDVKEAFSKYEFHRGVSILGHYINGELPIFVEMLKDRLYCRAADDDKRVVAQSILYHNFQTFQALLAPICPLLIEETWENTPPKIKEASIHPLKRVSAQSTKNATTTTSPHHWPNLMSLNVVIKSLQEKARNDKKMGSSTQSSVNIIFQDESELPETFSKPDPLQTLTNIPPSSLAEFFVLSNFSLNHPLKSESQSWLYSDTVTFPNGTKATVQVYPPVGDKCDRCWRWVVEDHDTTSSSSTTTTTTAALPKKIFERFDFSEGPQVREKKKKATAISTSTSDSSNPTSTSQNTPPLPSSQNEQEGKTPKLCTRCTNVLGDIISRPEKYPDVVESP